MFQKLKRWFRRKGIDPMWTRWLMGRFARWLSTKRARMKDLNSCFNLRFDGGQCLLLLRRNNKYTKIIHILYVRTIVLFYPIPLHVSVFYSLLPSPFFSKIVALLECSLTV